MVNASFSRSLTAFAALAFLGACSVAPPAAPPPPLIVRVPIPAPVYCDPPRIEKPDLPIAHLTPASPPADTVRFYAATVEILKGAVTQRDALLEGCRAKRGSNPSRN